MIILKIEDKGIYKILTLIIMRKNYAATSSAGFSFTLRTDS